METKKKYRTALYCRLSRDDGDKVESDSIVAQKHMLEDYCALNPEFTIISLYADDGYTGTNFNRPDFQRMLTDIEKGEIDCVIVKDLSRFGRDYIDIGFYLERYFPAKGVRFVAINDNVDSLKGPYDMMLPLKNVFNAQYAKDTSDKVRKSFHAKMRRGEFVSAFPPYGYAKDEGNKNRFVVDPEAAKNVLKIFEGAASGMSQRKIADLLNKEGVLSPIEYKHSKGIPLSVNKKYRGTCYWSDSAVARILKNEMYLGRMVSNRYPSDEMHGKHRLAPRGEWIIVEGTHEPIVSPELWDAAHRSVAQRRNRKPQQEKTGLFSGFLRCGDCGCALVKMGGHSKRYFCCAYKAYGAAACTKHAINEDVLSDAVLSDLNMMIGQVKHLSDLAEKACAKKKQPHHQGAAAHHVSAMISRVRRLKRTVYEEYRAGAVTRLEYVRQKAEYDKQESELLRESERRTDDTAHREESSEQPWVDNLVRLGKLETLDRDVLKETVREIHVYDDGRLELHYLFRQG